jgi:hypothetical protein
VIEARLALVRPEGDKMNDFSEQSRDYDSTRNQAGPLDSEDVTSLRPYIDFGAIRLSSRDDMQLRLEVEESTQRVVAITIEIEDSTLQLQAFAASRSEQMWPSIRQQLTESIADQGGSTEERIGAFGSELWAKLPLNEQATATESFKLARFIGVDGPRWFLRGIVGGAALHNALAAAVIDDVFRSVVVVRGESAVPPRDLLELKLPDGVIAPPRVVQS